MSTTANTELRELIRNLPRTVVPAEPTAYPNHWQIDIEELLQLLATQRQALLAESVPKLDQKCYNCGNFTVLVYDRARCPFCGVHGEVEQRQALRIIKGEQ